MSELENYINTYFGINPAHLKAMADLFEVTTLNKEEYFTQVGKQARHLSFIRSGYLRVFNYSDGKEVTQWLASPGEFIADLSSLVFSTPARWNIQALTDCEFYTLKRENYQRLGEVVPQWNELEKLFIAKCFLTLEDRVYTFLSMTAEERFMHLFQQKQELFNQVPLQYIASMLGMTPETLSRIRKKLTS
jgi:CRP-like cAMP-binding protein